MNQAWRFYRSQKNTRHHTITTTNPEDEASYQIALEKLRQRLQQEQTATDPAKQAEENEYV